MLESAIVVQGDRARVIGRSQVAIYDSKYTPGSDGRRYFFLKVGDALDLATRRPISSTK